MSASPYERTASIQILGHIISISNTKHFNQDTVQGALRSGFFPIILISGTSKSTETFVAHPEITRAWSCTKSSVRTKLETFQIASPQSFHNAVYMHRPVTSSTSKQVTMFNSPTLVYRLCRAAYRLMESDAAQTQQRTKHARSGHPLTPNCLI